MDKFDLSDYQKLVIRGFVENIVKDEKDYIYQIATSLKSIQIYLDEIADSCNDTNNNIRDSILFCTERIAVIVRSLKEHIE